MTINTKKYKTLKVKDLIELIKNSDQEQEIRVWVEMKTSNGDKYLEGRRGIGIVDSPNDKYCCLIAGFYE